MGKGNRKNQKKFIDKKNAVSFHLVHRSQRDPLASDALASAMVLQPTFVPHDRDYATMDPEVVEMLNADNMEEMMDGNGELAFDSDDDDDDDNDEDAAAGGGGGADDDDEQKDGTGKDKKKRPPKKAKLPHDYDYSKHLKDIDAGQFQRYKFADEGVLALASVRGAAPAQTQDEYDEEHKNDDYGVDYDDDGQGGATEEHFGLRLPVSALPSDLQRDYTGSSARDEIDRRFADIQGTVEPSNDFYMALNSELFDDAEDDQFDGVFEPIQDDFVAAAMTELDAQQLEDLQDIDERNQQREDDRAATEQAERDARPTRAVDDEFERALAGYDDEEIGELYSDDERLEGDVDNVAETFDDVLDDFLQQKDKNMEAMQNNESGGAAGVDEHHKKHVVAGLERIAATDNVSDAADNAALIEQFTPTEREAWDCETIISTYSNLENHPRIIKEPRRNAGNRLIKIDDRTGLPAAYTSAKLRQQRVAAKKNLAAKKATASAGATSLLYNDDDDDDDDDDDKKKQEEEDEEEWVEPVNQGAKRKKGETAAEKKARKEQAKLNKQASRARKKELKSMYKSETKVQVKAVTSNTAANPPAVKF